VFSHAGIKVNPCFESRRYFYARLPDAPDEAAPRRSADPRRDAKRTRSHGDAAVCGPLISAYHQSARCARCAAGGCGRVRPRSRISRGSALLLLRHAAIRVRERKSARRARAARCWTPHSTRVCVLMHGPRDYVNSTDPGEQRAGLSGSARRLSAIYRITVPRER